MPINIQIDTFWPKTRIFAFIFKAKYIQKIYEISKQCDSVVFRTFSNRFELTLRTITSWIVDVVSSTKVRRRILGGIWLKIKPIFIMTITG